MKLTAKNIDRFQELNSLKFTQQLTLALNKLNSGIHYNNKGSNDIFSIHCIHPIEEIYDRNNIMHSAYRNLNAKHGIAFKNISELWLIEQVLKHLNDNNLYFDQDTKRFWDKRLDDPQLLADFIDRKFNKTSFIKKVILWFRKY